MTSRATILIADDNELVRSSLTRLLEASGFRVLTAESGQAAIDLLGKNGSSIDCALIDLSMPEISGEQVIVALRKMGSDIPILIMSGYPPDLMDPLLSAIGSHEYLQKPFGHDELIASLQTLLPHLSGSADVNDAD